MNHSIPNAGHPQSAAPSLDSATPSFGHMHQSHNFSPLPKVRIANLVPPKTKVLR